MAEGLRVPLLHGTSGLLPYAQTLPAAGRAADRGRTAGARSPGRRLGPVDPAPAGRAALAQHRLPGPREPCNGCQGPREPCVGWQGPENPVPGCKGPVGPEQALRARWSPYRLFGLSGPRTDYQVLCMCHVTSPVPAVWAQWAPNRLSEPDARLRIRAALFLPAGPQAAGSYYPNGYFRADRADLLV